ncbi:hypothetical protein ABEB36_004258 [Hypothenemus hampei]|uniref:Translation initiation factor eIF2B subunit epsilon n=1 Tax=Hypothenemus hampei TaxID=57062 RepID=A0ABD1F2R5_HYPHA
MSKKKEVVMKENAVQAVLVADTFGEEFTPITKDVPLCLFPLVDKLLIDYTLEFLSLGGVEETFIFCCNRVAEVKLHINECIRKTVGWTLTMKVHIIVSESCHSFGDCLRDLDAKGLIRSDFILLEPGVVSNISLLPLLKKHRETCQVDKGAAMTVLFQESGLGHMSLCPEDEALVAVNSNNRVLFHKKTYKSSQKKVDFPLEMFLENSSVSIYHNLKDTHITICSSSVLPLFSDNFDFQTKDDFVRGLLMNEEIMGSTVYCNILRGTDYGGAIFNWRTYQSISLEMKNKFLYPLVPISKIGKFLNSPVTTTSLVKNTEVPRSSVLLRSIIGENSTIGENVHIQDSFIFDNVKIEDDVRISLSVIGPNCVIKKGSKVTAGSILGEGVVIDESLLIENSLVQATLDDNVQLEDKIGEHAFRLRLEEDEDDIELDKALAKRMSRLHVYDLVGEQSEYESDATFSESEEELSHIHSPPPDDTNLFFSEVIDSLTRGFDDNLQCDNLILEINSSRYAYNITVKEVNFNVIKAILIMSHNLPEGTQYFSSFAKLLSYFTPILRNYIKNESAMMDCLKAIEEVATSDFQVKDKWVIFVLKYFYEKDHLNETEILKWFDTLEPKSTVHNQAKPFAEWLQEAEEEDSDE